MSDCKCLSDNKLAIIIAYTCTRAILSLKAHSAATIKAL